MNLNADAAVLRCEQCGLPMRRKRGPEQGLALLDRFCCYGCYLTHRIAGEKGDEGGVSLVLARLALAGFLAMNVMTFSWALYGDSLAFLFPVEQGSRRTIEYLLFSLSLPVFLLIGLPYLKSAFEQIRTLRPGVDSLIAVGTSSAFLLSTWSTFTGNGGVYYDTATMVLVLVTFGRYLEANARLRTSASLQSLASHAPQQARLLASGGERMIPASEVKRGDSIRIAPGETIPADGNVIEGETTVDESLLTGEPTPVLKQRGSAVMGGSVNHDGLITVEATAVGTEMVMSHVVAMMKEVQLTKLPVQELADRISRIFTPGVVVLAAATVAFWTFRTGVSSGLLNGLSVLLIACPCALGIGATLAASVGYARCARNGILLRSLAGLERLGHLKRLFFDKTGTLTEGAMNVVGTSAVATNSFCEAQIVGMAASLEVESEHPVGRALVSYAREQGLGLFTVSARELLPGRGVSGEVLLPCGRMVRVRVGKNGEGYTYSRDEANQNTYIYSRVYVALDNVISLTFCLADRLRDGAGEAVKELKRLGVVCTILSGDRQEAVSTVSSQLGIDEGSGDLLPEGKIQLVREARASGDVVGMVGDGINDAPALASADMGIALRGGTDLSRQAADITVMDDDLRKIPWAISFARRIERTIRWNLGWAFAYNVAGIFLAASGVLQPVFAALAMVGSSVLVIVNSSRLAGGGSIR